MRIAALRRSVFFQNSTGSTSCADLFGSSSVGSGLARPVEVTGNAVSQGFSQTGFIGTVVDPRSQNQSVFTGFHTNGSTVKCNSQFAASVAGSVHQHAFHVFGSSTSTVSLTVPSGNSDVQVVYGSSVGTEHGFGGFGQVQTLSDTAADSVVLVSRQGDGSQNTDNGDNDHQLDQGETFLHCFHVQTPFGLVVRRNCRF